ncbi:MAG: ribonucleoside-diphosphate reductase subunit alpha [Spirochaetaceae bacterium]
MAVTQVVKRDGTRVPFDSGRIEAALAKAFEAAGEQGVETKLPRVLDAIVREIEARGSEEYPGVEEIQDIVERQLVKQDLYEVSKRYIIYRAKRAEEREQRGELARRGALDGSLTVQKRDGGSEPFSYEKVTATVERLAADLGEINGDLILKELKKNIYSGITADEVEQALLLATVAYIERDPQYNLLASRILRQKLYREVVGRSVDSREELVAEYRAAFVRGIRTGVERRHFDPRLLEFDLDALSHALDPSRDELIKYVGVQTLYERYFVKVDGTVLETPQGFWMRVAMGLSIEESDRNLQAQEFYNILSSLRFVSSTPTLFHAGLTHPQLSSCYLSTVGDDLENIFKCIGDNAQMSKWSGGIGNDWTSIRATGAMISSTKVESQGVIPFLKIANDTTVAINRSGKRRGATCAYLETWHLDIEDFLDLRRNTGDDRRRTHDMNTANWIPDLFMKRVSEEGMWTLFSPEEVPDLHETYGREFEERYTSYERMAETGEIKKFKKVEAIKLWRKMLTRLFETGHPWITFKDPSNIRSPQDHAGVVHNSNLCTEITLNNSSDETAVCNLGSVNLARHTTPEGVNHFLLGQTVKTAMRMLDNVIDINFYPTVEAKRSNLRHRPVGLGLMGFQDALFILRYPMDSEEARQFTDETMEFISYHAILASSELARERGSYESYPGSKWDRGIFPVDTIDLLEQERGRPVQVNREVRMDWSAVREHVATYGMRNSNTMAIAPTATISNIAGCFPCIEPIYKNLYVKSNMSGEFTIINEYLLEDLKRLGLWSNEMLEQLKYYDGNVAMIAGIPEELKSLYKEAFDIDPTELVKLTALRAKWIDQSQSHNVFMRGQSGKKLHEVYTAAWEMGLKTTYYLRTLGASQIEKSTLDAGKYGYTQKRVYNPGGGEAAPEEQEAHATGTDGGVPTNGSAAPGGSGLTGSGNLVANYKPATEVDNICSLTDPDCESCQ